MIRLISVKSKDLAFLLTMKDYPADCLFENFKTILNFQNFINMYDILFSKPFEKKSANQYPV